MIIKEIKETWRDIPGYEGYYQVSNYGRAKSLERIIKRKGYVKLNEHFLKSWCDEDGYEIVNLCKDHKNHFKKVHRLVAFAFPEICGTYFDGAVVNHKDENPANNCAWNLEWCTVLYNANYGKHNERVSRAQSKPVLQYTLDGTFVRRWWGCTEIFQETGWLKTSISACCLGKTKHSHGYIWRYE